MLYIDLFEPILSELRVNGVYI